MSRISIPATLLLCVLTVTPSRSPAQTAEIPVYDIVTVKPHKPGDGDISVRWYASTYEATNMDLKNMIASAYNVRNWLVFGLPPWAESAHFDIQAKSSESDPEAFKNLTQAQRRAMLATLLKDRFGLVVHNETKVQPVYELSVAPEGLKLKPTPPPPIPADGTPMQKPGSRWSTHNGEFNASNGTIATLCDNLSYQVDRFIVDKTGLADLYDLHLKWTPEDKLGKDADNGTTEAPPNIFTAIKEQLGLKLTPAKAPVPTLVVDKVERPQDN